MSAPGTFTRVIGLCVLLLGLATSARADDVSVAAAADLAAAFKEVAARFEASSGHHVVLSLGSSGNFFAQIQNGAPYDLFFSADIEYAQKLIDAGAAEPGSLHRYATGRIVLWAAKNSVADVAKGLPSLLAPEVKRVAIANPAHAPYGRAAMAALSKSGLTERVTPKLILGENVAQAAQFAETGNADAGIIALSLALSPAMKEKGKYFVVPPDLYPAIEQGAVVLKSAKHKRAAQAFVAFLGTPEIRQVMLQYGFQAPASPPAPGAETKPR